MFNEYSQLGYIEYVVDKDNMITYHTIPANEIPIPTIIALGMCLYVYVLFECIMC